MKASLGKTFLYDFKLNVYGSITFELLKIAHELALFSTIPMSLYGLKGFLFSILYLSISLADFGFVSGLAPLIKSATQNKKTFSQFLFRSFAIQIPLFYAAGFFAAQFAQHKFGTINFPLSIISLLIVTEGVRMFLRALLHTTFTTKPTIIAELSITSLYLLSVWTGHLLFKLPISLKLIFFPYATTSIIAVMVLLYLVFKFYKTLESSNQSVIKQPSTYSIFTTRITAYALTTPKKLFTGNFIIPLLSGFVGLEKLALIKYASYVAESAHSIIKATVGFSGNALLSALSQTKQHVKRIAFALISQKLAMLFYALICFIIFSIPTLNKLWDNNTTSQLTIMYTLLFLILIMMDHLFLMYEQFYLMERQAHKLLLIRSLELILFYGALYYFTQTNSIFLLLSLIAVRSMSFITLAIHGFNNWGLIPSISISLRNLIITTCSTAFAATLIQLLL